MFRLLLIISVACIITIPTTNAQLFKKLVDRTTDKIAQRAEDKIVEGVSNELANRAMRPIDKAFDDIFRASYEKEYGEEWDDSEYEGDPEARSAAMTALMRSMYGNVDLPPSYEFDYEIDIEVTDEGSKKPTQTTLLLAKNQAIMGAVQQEDGKSMKMVYDFDKDQVAIFNDDDNTVMAMSGVMTMAMTMAKSQSTSEDWADIEIKKTGKSKTVAGYKCDEYEMKSKDGEGKYCISTNLPIDWSNTWGKMSRQFTGNLYNENFSENLASGMLMEAKMKDKTKKKNNETKWKVTDVNEDNISIATSGYKNALGN